MNKINPFSLPMLPSFLVIYLIASGVVLGITLSTIDRWIVDENAERVKFACVNWPSHLETIVAEGLSKQPLDVISKKIGSMGFNCVRLTYPISLVTDGSLAYKTVLDSFEGLELHDFIAGFQANNPSFLSLTLTRAFQAVVSNLGENNVMVILDNHISKQGWCCSEADGNGFFGDQYFDPDLWLKGLTQMATMFSNTSNVVAMSLRNELRGHRENVDDWYRYMQQGAEVVHSSNPNVLVILSGLNFAADFSFLKDERVSVTFQRKLVFEVHWYRFYDKWEKGTANEVCQRVVNALMDKVGFLLEQGWPLFLSEFGLNLSGNDIYESRYLSCLLGVVAELDIDWALWALQGSYYVREGVKNTEELYGVLSYDWNNIRNPSFMQKISAIQSPFQGPGLPLSPKDYNIVYHPPSGLCISFGTDNLKLALCNEAKAWIYTPEKTIKLLESNSCLLAVDEGGSPIVGNWTCSDPLAKWDLIGGPRMQLAAVLPDTTAVCLDSDNKGVIVTNRCKCLVNGDNDCDPASQWFKVIRNSRHLSN